MANMLEQASAELKKEQFYCSNNNCSKFLTFVNLNCNFVLADGVDNCQYFGTSKCRAKENTNRRDSRKLDIFSGETCEICRRL